MAESFPLSTPTFAECQKLTEILWSWKICAACQANEECQTEACPWYRSTSSLKRFIRLYHEKTRMYSCQTPNFSHEGLFSIMEKLKSSPDITRTDLARSLFPDWPTRSDQERAIDLAVQIMFMINCSIPREEARLVEAAESQFPWRSNLTLVEYIDSLFVKTHHSDIAQFEKKLGAVKLKKSEGLMFEPTDDIKCHLKFDHDTGVVEIFHHAAFLKEHLRLTKNSPPNMTTLESLKM